MTTTCTVRLTELGRDCAAPAVADVAAACVHEHVEAGPVCARCLARLRAGRVHCGPCCDAAASHACPLRLPAAVPA